MVRHLPASHFFIFLFVVVCRTLCLAGYAGGSAVGVEEAKKKEESFEILNFEKTKQDVQSPTDANSKTNINIDKINFPLFFAAKNNLIVAVAGAEYKEVSGPDSGGTRKEKVGVIARYFEANDNVELDKRKINESIEKGKTQLTTQNDEEKTSSTIKTFVVNADGDKICVFLVGVNDNSDGSQKWDFKFVEGTVNGNDGSKTIKWNKESSIQSKDIDNLKTHKITLFVAHGSAFFTKDKKFVFVVKGEHKEMTQAEKYVTAFIQLKEAGNELEFLDFESTKDFYTTFFQWGGEIFKIPTDGSKDSGKGKILVFNDGDEKFTKTNNSIVRFHNFLKGKNNFFTATILDKDTVLLFTQQRDAEGGNSNGGMKKIYLWMTDGTRVSCAGIISPTDFTGTFYVSLLYTGNKLFALYQTSEMQETNKVYLTLLKDQLENITNTLSAWNKSNNEIKQLYEDTVTPTNIKFTDGIVGFLSGDGGNTINWKDGYLYADASVKLNADKGNAINKNNGFKFTGAGAGAQWPIRKATEDQPYNFVDSGCTLLATVAVGSGIKGEKFDNSILGVLLTDKTKNRVGLWCSTDGKWEIRNGQTKAQSPEINCAPDEKHYVALILNGSEKVSVYVNGQQLTELDGDKIKIDSSKNVEHFYFGANTDNEKTDVTITDVLLYNRPFTSDEAKELKPKKNTEANTQQNQSTDTKQQNPEESATRNDIPPPKTSATKNDEAQSSPPPTTEDSAARVGVVGVLCFMLFGVFTLLGRYVY